jgi:ankyrin repeat protein
MKHVMKSRVLYLALSSMAGLLLAACGPSTPRTPLHAAAQQGNYPAIRQHIAARSDLNATDKAGWTALHLAAMAGDVPMVQLLADAGADVARPGPGGQTPLHVAREKGQTSVVQYLVSRPPPAPEPGAPERSGRRLMDGGLGVSEVLDAH